MWENLLGEVKKDKSVKKSTPRKLLQGGPFSPIVINGVIKTIINGRK